MIDIEAMSMESPVAWVEQSKIRLANGDTYSFKDRPYLIRPLASQARRKCIPKATQLGFSETFILDSLHGCISGRYRQGVDYIFPNDTDMRTFVQSRFNPLIRDNPDTIGKYVKNTDTTSYKRVGGSNLFFDGGRLNQTVDGQQKESVALRSKALDKVVLDESDLMDASIVQKAEGRMAESDVKGMTIISNPTVENHKIDRLYNLSNQMHWFRRCSCGEWTCPDEEFPNLISKKGCHCSKCGKVLGYTGEWVAKFKERNDLIGKDAQDWEGYQLSQLNSKSNNPWIILQEFKNPPDGNIEDFWKLRMGRAYTPKENRLTTVEVYDCCSSYTMSDTSQDATVMGVDVGKNKYHYIIGIRTAKDRYEVLKYGCAESFEEIGTIALRMNVRKCVVDIRPYEAAARRFQKEMNFQVYLCQYTDNAFQEAVWDVDSKIVKAYRTGLFDITHRLVVEKRVRFPYRNKLTDDFAKQYCEPYKYKTEDLRSGSVVYRYDKGNGNDHYRNTMNYFYLAASASRIYRPYKIGGISKTNKARHETVKI